MTEQEQKDALMRLQMYNQMHYGNSGCGTPFYLMALLAVVWLFASCGSSKNLTNETTQKDSVRVEVRTETVYVTDTCYVEIPAITL